jgi:hypothetical protein
MLSAAESMRTVMTFIVAELVLLLSAFGAFALALETGFRLGRRRQARSDEPEKSHVTALHTAVLGLLALLLGFTFAMAVSRYEARKTLGIDQANAIGTALLRARLLPEPYATRAFPLLREYVNSRLEYNAAGSDEAGVVAAEAHGARLENQLWEIARGALNDDPRSQPASLFTQVLNDVFDLREKRRFALNDHVPAAVSVLLYSVAITAMGLVAYGCGLSGRRRASTNLTFAFLIALALIIIMDIDRPREGVVRVSQESLVRLHQSLDTSPK